MFGTLGGPEVILILVIALIVFGPRRLPEIGKSMGKMLAEFRKASNDFKRTIEDELEAEKAKESQPPSSSVATETPESTAVPSQSTTPDVVSAPPAIEYAPPPWTPAATPAEAPPPPVVAPEEVIVSREPPAEKK